MSVNDPPPTPPRPHDPDAIDPQEAATRPIHEDTDVTSALDDPSRPPASSDTGSGSAGSGQASDLSADLFQPAAAAAATPAAATPARDQLGRYRLLGSPDGQSPRPVAGGEGHVYRARAEGGGPLVALKTPLPQYADHRKRCARLIHEARQLRSMDHPAIVKVFDIDEQHQPPYYTMALLPGGSLSQKLKEDHPLATAEVLRLAIPLADAVRYVHETKGVSHRDIKPQNVMLDEHENPVFVDFGLSRDNTGDEASIVDAAHDATSQRFKVGTLLYMAPELFEGKAGNSQTDIYAFGVMLYVMSTGKRPYDGRDFESLSNQKRMHNPPEALSVYPQLDARLDRIIGHATARRAKDRYATMEDLLEDLQAIRDGHAPLHAPQKRRLAPPPAAPVPPAGGSAFLDPTDPTQSTAAAGNASAGSSAPPSRGGWTKALVAAVLFIALAGGGYYLMQHPESLQAGVAAVAAFLEREDEPTSGVNATLPPDADADAGMFSQYDQATPSVIPPVAPPIDDGTTATPLTPTLPAPDAAVDRVPLPSVSDTPAPGPTTAAGAANATATAITAAVEDADAEVQALLPQISARLRADPALDARAVQTLESLLEQTTAASRPGYRDQVRQWAHDAAARGAEDSLAWLITHAQDFDLASSMELPSGYTWLHAAVRSSENTAFAEGFADWMAEQSIDPAVLTAAPAGRPTPRALAESLGRSAWVTALDEATAAAADEMPNL